MYRPAYWTFFLILILLAPPALGADTFGDGNSPGLPTSEIPASLAQAQATRWSRLLKSGAHVDRLQRIRPKSTMVPFAGIGELEVLSSVGTVTFAQNSGQVTSTTQLTIQSLIPSLSSFYLLLEELVSGSISFEDSSGPLNYKDLGYGLVEVQLNQPLAEGASITLTVHWSGKPSCDDSWVVTCTVNSELIMSMSSSWQPRVINGTLTDYLPAQVTTVALTVPGNFLVASTFLETNTTSNPDGTLTVQLSSPAEDIYAFSAAPYVSGTTPLSSDQDVRSYISSPLAIPYAAAWRQVAVEALGFHGQRYDPYTLKKIDVAEMPNNTGAGGFGPFSAVFIAEDILSNDPSQWYNKGTLAHELAHQWFGGYIQLGDSNSPWINEGFASFAENEFVASAAQQQVSTDVSAAIRQLTNLRYVYITTLMMDTPLSSAEIYEVPLEVYVVVTYDKGAMVVSMLRYLLGGDNPFFAALQQYRQDHLQSEATVSSLLASLENASGVKVGSFLEEWVMKSGYPTIQVAVERTQSGGGDHGATITLTSDKPPHLPLEIELVLADGSVERQTIPLSGTQASASYTTATEVLQVVFDPDHQLVGRSRGALAGDIALNGEVDGIDLIYAAWANGQGFNLDEGYITDFPVWADLVFDAMIDQSDLEVVLNDFGQTQGG